ncbi:MAG: hypothetical protein WCG48_03395 [Candidatus Berkelbacteria bacterium]
MSKKKTGAKSRNDSRVTLGSGVKISRGALPEEQGIVVGFHRDGRVQIMLMDSTMKKVWVDPTEVVKTSFAPTKARKQAEITFSLGDTVIVIEPHRFYHGRNGKVSLIEDGYIFVDFSRQEADWFPPKDLARC